MPKHLLIWLLLVTWIAVSFGPVACRTDEDDGASDGDTDGDTDTDTDSDSDSDSDSDTDSDSDADTDTSENEVCIAVITGSVRLPDGTPVTGEATLRICAPGCSYVPTDNAGHFEYELPVLEGEVCRVYDFSLSYMHIHITVLSPELHSHAPYIANFKPTHADVSDLGPDDYTYDVGELILYPLPAQGIPYTKETGAVVEMAGASLELAPESLVESVPDDAGTGMVDVPIDTADIKVINIPLDEWNPAFNYFDLDAIYFLGPYWTKLAVGGATLSLDPPDGWSEGDSGMFYMLSDYFVANYLAYAEDGETCVWQQLAVEYIKESTLAECGTATVVDGRVQVPPLPLLSWIGIKK